MNLYEFQGPLYARDGPDLKPRRPVGRKKGVSRLSSVSSKR